MTKLDLVGQKYGLLTVVSEVERTDYTRRFWCTCDCGNPDPVKVTMPNLRNGHTTSCGCVQKKRTSAANTSDLTGRKFGRLTVLRRSETKSKNRRQVDWICRCDCGNPAEVTVTGTRLINGITNSCGCLRNDAINKAHEVIRDVLTVDGVVVPTLTRKRRSDNQSGHKGVSVRTRKNGNIVYSASIRVKGKTYWLGEHKTLEDAIRARKLGEVKYHQPYIDQIKKSPPQDLS